jgi:predicted transposase/invertase (TIGR01784 family)
MAAINDSLNRKVDETAYHVPEIQRVLDMITVDSISPEEGARIIDENNIELLKREWRDEGVKRGIKKGMKEGMEKGIKEGIEKGIKEGVNKGQHQKALEIAKALKASGMTIEQIAQLTSLTLDELNKLT